MGQTILVDEIYSWKWFLVKRIEKILWYKIFGQNKFGETNLGKNNFVAKKHLVQKIVVLKKSGQKELFFMNFS